MDVQRPLCRSEGPLGPFQRSRRGPLNALEGALSRRRPPGRNPGYVPVPHPNDVIWVVRCPPLLMMVMEEQESSVKSFLESSIEELC